MKQKVLPVMVGAALTMVVVSASAQISVPVDSGQVLRDTIEPPPLRPADRPIDFGAMEIREGQPGGASITIKQIMLSGNTLFDTPTLLQALGDFSSRSYDLAELRSLANAISRFYRERGYPFVRTFVPPQDLTEGTLRLDIVEGRYGRIGTEGASDLATPAMVFTAALGTGDPIASKRLERVALVLDDQPGMRVTPIVRPGDEVGTGDLSIRVERESNAEGLVGVDNAGNRYTGLYRLRADVAANSPFMFGDRLSLRSMLTDEGQWQGNLEYELPLNGHGLRAKLGVGHTSYTLGDDFEDLEARGSARVTQVGLSYPLLRTQRSNVIVSLNYQRKKLKDSYRSFDLSESKSSRVVPLTVQFDHRDGLGGGAITYGAFTATRGQLYLGGDALQRDRTTARTDGSFTKLNLDVARIQRLPAGFSLFGRYSAQWANQNLDSSEGFSLGGVNGVRAYPSGEASGDEGWLLQTELRYAVGNWTPFLFYDSGIIRQNADSWTREINHRRIAGAGVGACMSHGDWNGSFTLGWRTDGGAPTADTRDRTPRLFLSLARTF